MIKYSVITSEIPAMLTKQYCLNEAGELVKTSGGQMSKGTVTMTYINDLADFAARLPSLQKNQALCYGVPIGAALYDTIEVVADKHKVQGQISRTIGDFVWDDGPGIFFLDHDDNMSKDQFYEAVCSAMPELSDTDYVWYPSSSSMIFNNGRQLRGITGQRLYFIVDKASEMPRIGKALHQRLWLSGHGKIQISAAGSMLERSAVDATVWQCNRLDFAAGALCKAPLEQKRGQPIYERKQNYMICSQLVGELSPNEESLYKQLVSDSRLAMKGDAEKTRDQHIEKRVAKLPPEKQEQHRRVLKQAYSSGVLTREFLITVFCNGSEETVPVEYLLMNRKKYDGCITLDPIEPEYNGYHKTGKAYLADNNPLIRSQAHGGRTFYLTTEKATDEAQNSCSGTQKMADSIEAQIEGKITTISLPWRRLSHGCKALRPGTVTIIAGPSKSGKSYFTMNIIRDVHEAGYPWAYLPLEDDRESWGFRMLAILEQDYRMTDKDEEGARLRLNAFGRRRDEIDAYLKRVTENPYIGQANDVGDIVIPEVTSDNVLSWLKRAVKQSRVVVIDPLSQITFKGRNIWEDESKFIRTALGISAGSGASVIIVAHTRKPNDTMAELTAEDVQGSAMLTRLAHTTLLLRGFQMTDKEINAPGNKTEVVQCNRAVTIATTRFGAGSNSSLAFLQDANKPAFHELGFIAAKKKGKK
jgi:KaiC/GvpD/RAD55 family RecA-like ATPase